MEHLIKAECDKMLKEVEKKFYDGVRKLQRDIINATAKQYGFDKELALREYNLEEIIIVPPYVECQPESYSDETEVIAEEEEEVIEEVKEEVIAEEKEEEVIAEEEEEVKEEEKEEVKEEVIKVKKPPKKPATSYSYFIKDKKSGVAKEFPEMVPAEITKKMREWWNKIKGGPEADIYHGLHRDDKSRYEAEILIYNTWLYTPFQKIEMLLV